MVSISICAGSRGCGVREGFCLARDLLWVGFAGNAAGGGDKVVWLATHAMLKEVCVTVLVAQGIFILGIVI